MAKRSALTYLKTVGRPGRRDLLLPLGIIALCITVTLIAEAFSYLFSTHKIGADSQTYLLAARHLVDGAPLYPSGADLAPGPLGLFLYPPVVAAFFVPWLLLPQATLLWFALMAALAAAVSWSLVRSARPALRPWVLAACVGFSPLLWELQVGNVTLLTLGMCLLAWHWRDNAARAGLVLGLALAWKLLPLLVLPFLIASGRLRLAAFATCALAATVLLSWPLLGSQWIEFVLLLGTLAMGQTGDYSNLVPTLFRSMPMRLMLPALGLGVACIGGLAARRRPALAHHAYVLTLATCPLLSPTFWFPYLVLSAPLLFTQILPAGRIYIVGRGIAWMLIASGPASRPSFILPLLGYLLVLVIGLLELLTRYRPNSLQTVRRWPASTSRGAD